MTGDDQGTLQYFEAPSMRKLYARLAEWQAATRQRLVSVAILNDQGVFCCIALTEPRDMRGADGPPPGAAHTSPDARAATA